MLPIPMELEALEKAFKFIGVYPERDIIAWLIHKTGRHITRRGLKQAVKREYL